MTVYFDDEEHHREINGPTFHLALDPKVFIGGGDNFVVTRGKGLRAQYFTLHWTLKSSLVVETTLSLPEVRD